MSAIQSVLAGYGGTAAGGGSTPDTIGSGLLVWNQNGVGRFQDIAKTTPAVDTDLGRVWADSSGNGNDLTVGLSGDTARPVAESGGFHFDGSNDTLIGTTALTLKPATLFVLVNFDAVAAVQAVIAGAGGLGLTANTNFLQAKKTGHANIGTANTTLSASTWYRLILTYDGSGNFEFFRNGVSDGTGTQNETILSIEPKLSDDTGSGVIDGIVKDWGAYDNVLSGGDITALDDYLASI